MSKVFTVILLSLCLHTTAKTFYVNKLATGLNDGTSWANAYIDLQDALGRAVSGDIIKVAAGIYKPSRYNSDIDRETPFRVSNGAVILGGYPDSGNPTDAERNWINHPTILSGAIAAGPSYFILLAKDIVYSTVIDGFVVKEGGIGIQIVNSKNLTIKNTVFQDALVCDSSSIVVTNCVFTESGSILNRTNSNATFYNCVTIGTGVSNTDAFVSLINCTVVNGGGGFGGSGKGKATITNCIFWNNINSNRDFEGTDIVPGNQTIQVNNSITQTYFTARPHTILVASNPRFLDIRNPAGPDGKFFTSDDGLQLTGPCSPGLNYGDNSVLAGINTDIVGNPRIYNSGQVDLGAYEMQSVPATVRTSVFVNNSPSNTGNNDGSSWQNAFKTLQQAFLYCSDTIKISEGIYLTDNSYEDSVFIVENKKVIIGGYPATGNPGDADRNPSKYPTILKGNYFGPPYLGRSVLKSYNNDSTTIIDGLAFSNAGTPSVAYPVLISHGSKLKIRNCNFFIDSTGKLTSGIYITKSASPSISKSTFGSHTVAAAQITLEQNSHVNISFCSFTDYASDYRPAAIDLFNSSAVIDSCTFIKRWGSVLNPAMLTSENGHLEISRSVFHTLRGSNAMVSYINTNGTFNDCVFKNRGGIGATTIVNDNSSPVYNKCFFDSSELSIINRNRSTPVFNNCVSVNARFMENRKSFPVLNHCTLLNIHPFTTDHYLLQNGLSENPLILNLDSSVLRANNTIFWSDKLRAGVMDIEDRNSAASKASSILTNCLTQNFGTDGLNGNKVGKDPRFFQQRDFDGPDNVIFTADDGIRLANCSPAVNAGNNSAGTVFSSDILNNPRMVDAVVDMGAYELQASPGATNRYYVNASASGSNTGVDWQNAYTDLQMAVCNPCADTIKVATGTYKPAVAARDSVFFINRAISLYGGYPSSGNPGDDLRDPSRYPTILSGNVGDTNDSIDSSAVIVYVGGVPDSVIIDGFTIEDAYHTTSPTPISLRYGAGLLTYRNHIIVRNCQFLRNRVFNFGGGISIGYGSSANVSNCIFDRNHAGNYGGGLGSIGTNVRISNCVFDNNSANGQGGALYLEKPFDISNCIFYQNYTMSSLPVGRGGAVYAQGSVGSLYNCTFYQNRTGYDGSSISQPTGGGFFWVDPQLPTLHNCIFSGNTAAGSATVRNADINYTSTFTNNITQFDYYEGRYVDGRSTKGNPKFLDSTNPKGPDGIWMTPDDGLQLSYNSPAIDTGTNRLPGYLTTDLIGNSRIINGKVDLGPYEFSNNPLAQAGTDTLICLGSSVQLGKAGNPTHIYTWSSSPSGFTSNLGAPTVSPTLTTTYFLEVSNGSIVSKDTVTVSVSSAIVPSVSVSATATNICEGTNIIFTATPATAGSTPTYQWQVNNVNAGINSNIFGSSTLTNGSQVKVMMTSSAGCASVPTVTSNVVTITVNAKVAPSVSISSTETTICKGTNVVFTATPVNGGANPFYQWKLNSLDIMTGPTYNSRDLLHGDVISVILTSYASCITTSTATSNSIKMAILSAFTPSVTISGATTLDKGAATLITATIVNGGSIPVYQWEDSTGNHSWQIIPGATTSSLNYTPASIGDKTRCKITSSSNCASPRTAVSNTLMFVLNAPLPINSVPIEPNEIFFYPNPVRSTLFIDSLNVDHQW